MKAPDYPIANSTLRRRTPLPKATAPMKRTRLKARGGSRFPKQRQPEYTAWIKSLPCEVANGACWSGIHPAHVNQTRARGAPDVGEVVPLCPFHHAEQEGRTARFNAKYRINLHAIAELLATRYADERGFR